MDFSNIPVINFVKTVANESIANAIKVIMYPVKSNSSNIKNYKEMSEMLGNICLLFSSTIVI